MKLIKGLEDIYLGRYFLFKGEEVDLLRYIEVFWDNYVYLMV